MGSLQINPSYSCCYRSTTCSSSSSSSLPSQNILPLLSSPTKTTFRSTRAAGGTRIKVVSNIQQESSPVQPPEDDAAADDQGPPMVHLAFVHSVLLPDGTPDLHTRNACGGQKLRDIMLDTNIDLYGPYARPLLNCAGGGTCATCTVEVIQGKELLNPRTDKEKEKLKKKPKNWRLACQTTVGTPESRGLVVIQQLPEWKAHEWEYKRLLPSELLDEENE